MTIPPSREMHLGVFVQIAGHHIGGWRLPEAAMPGENLALASQIARTAERGLFDMVFLGDSLSTSAMAAPSVIARFEPLTLLAALAVETRHVGLVATVSTTYGAPYHVARQFASLDHLSAGRAGWNVVTSTDTGAAQNFGLVEQLDLEARYDRALEFVDVVRGLWDSWDAGAFPRDKASGRYVDPSRLHALDHAGRHFRVRGPLNVDRTPQGQPVLVQAGSSAPGMAVAAEVAEVIFTAQPTLDEARRFYRDIKARITAAGRDAARVAVMPGVMPITAPTRAEALALFDRLQSHIDIDLALAVLSTEFGFDMAAYPLDAPLPDLPPTVGAVSRAALFRDMARRDGLTLRQLALLAAAARGHHIVIGAPDEIADDLQLWFESGAADGFNIMPAHFPGGLDAFVDLVVPILQERGLFRTRYPGTTLRQSLGLAVPPSRHAAAPSQARSGGLA
ncbi:MAG: LLM class flavin-dependent oxidoreductase [Paracoccus aminovorans]|nr:LLM class flavin-dependent oxidoreductase [Paracoccus aminovorans]